MRNVNENQLVETDIPQNIRMEDVELSQSRQELTVFKAISEMNPMFLKMFCVQ